AGRQFPVISPQCPLHLCHGTVPGSQPCSVQPYADSVAPFTANTDIGHTIQHGSPVTQDPLGKTTELGTGPHPTAERYPPRRPSIGISFLYDRRVGSIRQLV